MGMFASDSIKACFGSNRVSRFLRRLNPDGSATIATFPSSLVINAATIVSGDDLFGKTIQRHMHVGNITQHEAVQLWLLMHRAMGEHSPYAPYLQTLPAAYDTPLHYPEADLARNLAGTTLYHAVKAMEARVERDWQGVQPVLMEMQQLWAQRSGRPAAAFSAADWKWAFSTLWSRSLALPVNGADPESMTVQSLVPGLDMANHDTNGTCRWRVRGDLRDSGSSVELVAPVWRRPKTGQEICLQYTDESNESFLFLYGFTEVNNARDAVLLTCPVGPEHEWDDLLKAKMHLLKGAGLTTQFKLPRVRPCEAGSEPLPPEGRAVLETLVMTQQDLKARLAAQDAEAAATGGAPKKGRKSGRRQPGKQSFEEVGLDMAVYTTFCKLLELQLHALEGPQGTGPLEADVEIIARGPEALSCTEWSCVMYRAGQKRIVREYLSEANKRLQEIMGEMRASMQSRPAPPPSGDA